MCVCVCVCLCVCVCVCVNATLFSVISFVEVLQEWLCVQMAIYVNSPQNKILLVIFKNINIWSQKL
jgi:hypothetical protein